MKKLQSLNKTTVAVIAGAIVTVLASFLAIDGETQGALQTILTAGLVWLIPNVVSS